MNKYDKFYSYLEEILKGQERLAELLMRKLDSVNKSDTDSLGDIIKEEQVFALVAKGFDLNIQRYREQLSLKGSNMSEIIPTMPIEEQQRFREIFHILINSVELTRSLNLKCQDLLEQRLHNIDKALNRLDKSKTASYNKTSENESAGETPRLLATSI